MPAADGAKTKSAHKQPEVGAPHVGASAKRRESWWKPLARIVTRKRLLYAIGVSLALLAVLAPKAFFQPATATLQLGDKQYSLDIVSTDETRAKGLGGRAELASSAGMLFVFEHEQQECFWMKDMHFPIDIVWLNDKKQVVHVERNVSPDTYPNQFCPIEPATYVIELGAGQAHGVSRGQKLAF